MTTMSWKTTTMMYKMATHPACIQIYWPWQQFVPCSGICLWLHGLWRDSVLVELLPSGLSDLLIGLKGCLLLYFTKFSQCLRIVRSWPLWLTSPWLSNLKWHCERRLWIVCTIHWTRIFSITNDSSQDHGYHLQTAWMRRRSSRRSISLHSSKNGGRSEMAQSSMVRMSRFVNTSSTTQVAKVTVKHWRSRGSSCAKIVRTSTCRSLVGKTIWERFIETRIGQGTELGMSATLRAAVHLGQDYEAKLRYVKNHLWKSVRQLFIENEKLIGVNKQIS